MKHRLWIFISGLLVLIGCGGFESVALAQSVDAVAVTIVRSKPPVEAADPSRFVWEGVTLPHTWQHQNWVISVAFSPDGQQVLTGSVDGTAVLRDARSGNTLHTWRHKKSVRSVAFSPDGQQVLTGSVDGTAVLRDVRSGNTLHTWRHQGWVTSVAFSPDGQQVLTGSWDNTAVLRDVRSGNTLHTWQHEGHVWSVVFSPDGQQVLTGPKENTAVLRDVRSGNPLHTWQHQGDVYSVAFSPDGQQVLTGSKDNTAVLRDVRSGNTLHTWRDQRWVQSVAFSPDGQQVLTGSADQTTVLRDVRSGNTLHTWRHENDVESVAFSPDGQQVLTGSDDNTAVLRDVRSGNTLHTWRHQNYVRSVAFSPDGQQVLTGSFDNTAVLRSNPSSQKTLVQAKRFLQQRVTAGIATAVKRHRQLPPVLARQAALRTSPTSTKLTKGEFESTAEFVARVAAFKVEVQQHYANLTPLPLSERTRVMHTALIDAYGTPTLDNARYDADTEVWYLDFGASRVTDFQRTLVLPMPRATAQARQAAVRAATANVTMRVTEHGDLLWQQVRVRLADTDSGLLVSFTDDDYSPAVLQIPIPTAPSLNPTTIQIDVRIGADP